MTHFPTHDFRVGDIVHLRNGTSRQEVMEIRDHVISARYLSCKPKYYNTKWRAAADFVLDQPNCPKEDQPMNQNTLYKVIADEKKFGNFLTEDGDGNYVLQMAGGGYEAFKPDDLEKVCPYTVQVKFTSGSGAHFKMPKDIKLTVGDLVVIGKNLGMVVELDTRRDEAQKPKGEIRRVLTEAVTG